MNFVYSTVNVVAGVISVEKDNCFADFLVSELQT